VQDNYSDESKRSLKAITDTLQSVFAVKPDPSREVLVKRTFVKRPSGQIMTELNVLEQMKEQRRKKDLKKSTCRTHKSTSKKCQKIDQNGIYKYMSYQIIINLASILGSKSALPAMTDAISMESLNPQSSPLQTSNSYFSKTYNGKF
jgi:hypothetical protein